MDPNFRKERQTPQTQKKGGNGKFRQSGDKTFVSARADVEKYKAAEYRLKHEINQGLWLKKSEVKDQAFKAARLMRDSLINVPSRVAALVAAESEQNLCYQIIHKEIKEVLDEYVRQLKALGK